METLQNRQLTKSIKVRRATVITSLVSGVLLIVYFIWSAINGLYKPGSIIEEAMIAFPFFIIAAMVCGGSLLGMAAISKKSPRLGVWLSLGYIVFYWYLSTLGLPFLEFFLITFPFIVICILNTIVCMLERQHKSNQAQYNSEL